MKWPWVSRGHLEDVRHVADRAFTQSADAIRMAEHATNLALRMLTVLEHPATPKQVTERNPLPIATPAQSDLLEAIDLASGTDKGLARHLSRWAKQQALDGMKERDIIQSILHWPRASEWDGEPDDVPEPQF